GPLVLRAKLTSPDMYTSLDLAVDCLEEQLRRDKDRNKHHHRRAWGHHQQGTFAEVEITVEDAAGAASGRGRGGDRGPGGVPRRPPGGGGRAGGPRGFPHRPRGP